MKFIRCKLVQPALDSRISHKTSYINLLLYGILPYFLEFFPPLNCFFLAQAEQNKPCPWIVPAPCAYAITLVGMAQCSIARVAPHCVAKLVETIIYDRSTVQCGYIRSICHDQVQISSLFERNLLEAQCAYKREGVAILIIHTLVLFLPSNCTHMLPHCEINSTRRKYSRKCGICKGVCPHVG